MTVYTIKRRLRRGEGEGRDGVEGLVAKRAMAAGGAGDRRLPRRDFLRLGGAGLLGMALVGAYGCGGESARQGAGGGETALTFAFWPEQSGTLERMISRFNERYEGDIRVEWRQMPVDTQQYFDQLRNELQAGGSKIDVMGGDVVWPAQFAANGYIADLSDRFTEGMRGDFFEGPVAANTYEGKVYGVPFYTDAGMLYYRQDLLEKAGFSEPPKTWDQLKEMAGKVMRDSRTRFGFVFQGERYEGGVCDGLEYVWSHGGDVLDPDDATRIIVGSPESAAGLAEWRSMISDGVSPESVTVFKEDESAGAFLNGDSVFMRNWSYVFGIASDPEQSKVRPEQVGVAALPAAPGKESSSTLGGWNYFINAASEKQDAAWEFIKFMSAPEQQKAMMIGASFRPTLRALYEDRELLRKAPIVTKGIGALENSRPRPVSPYYSDMSLVMQKQFNASLKGDTSPEEAVDTMQEELQKIADQA
jgi:multiple sugar transport system substrate-binding protein